MYDKTTLLLASFFVAFAALANLVRLIWDIPVSIGSLYLPGWTGGIAYFILGILSVWSFRALGALCDPTQEFPSDP